MKFVIGETGVIFGDEFLCTYYDEFEADSYSQAIEIFKQKALYINRTRTLALAGGHFINDIIAKYDTFFQTITIRKDKTYIK